MDPIKKVIYKCTCTANFDLIPGKFNSTRNPTCPNCGYNYGKEAAAFIENVEKLNASILSFDSFKKNYTNFTIE